MLVTYFLGLVSVHDRNSYGEEYHVDLKQHNRIKENKKSKVVLPE